MARTRKEKKLMDVVALGRQGGKVRAQRMSAQERSEAARKAVQARWAKKKPK